MTRTLSRLRSHCRRLPVAAALALMVAVVVTPANNVGALAPDRVGWWSAIEQLPVAIPQPGVPAGGMQVQQGPSGPTAFGALHYAVPPRSAGTLLLVVAQGSSVLTTAIDACPTTKAWTASAGPGAWADRPGYGTNCSAGKVAADGSAVAFEVSSSQTAAGALDVAIVPHDGSSPFSVALDAPDAKSLALASVDAAPPPPPAAAAPAPPDTTAPAPADTAPASLPQPSGVPADTSVPSATPAPPAPAVAAPAPQVVVAAPAATRASTDDRGARLVALLLMLALIAGWWFVGGQPAREPRLLGALAGGSGPASRHPGPPGPAAPFVPGAAGAAPGPQVVRVAGIGRFARPRADRRPRRL